MGSGDRRALAAYAVSQRGTPAGPTFRDRLRHVGHGRLDRLGRRRSRARRSTARSSSAATSSTRPGPTATATASGCWARLLRATRARGCTSRRRCRRRTAAGRASAEYAPSDVFPVRAHRRDRPRRACRTSACERLDLQQLHVWGDAWADDDGWQRAAEDLKQRGLIGAFGISVNRWEPANVLQALETGLVDAVQVVYNVFDQAPEDELFPACQRDGVAVIARVPFDEGSLTGTLTRGPTLARGRLAEHLLHAAPARRRRSTASTRCAAGCRGLACAARSGAAFHPAPPGGLDDDPGHAHAGARREQPAASATGAARRRRARVGCARIAGSACPTTRP